MAEKGAEKKSFALRIDAELMQRLEGWAADEFRSVNGQIEYLLYRALQDAGRLPRSRKEPGKK